MCDTSRNGKFLFPLVWYHLAQQEKPPDLGGFVLLEGFILVRNLRRASLTFSILNHFRKKLLHPNIQGCDQVDRFFKISIQQRSDQFAKR